MCKTSSNFEVNTSRRKTMLMLVIKLNKMKCLREKLSDAEREMKRLKVQIDLDATEQ